MGKDLPDQSIAIDSHKQALQQLISRTIPQDELPSLIETIFSDKKAIKTADPLQKSDAQAFIDVIDRVRHYVPYFEELVGLLRLQFPHPVTRHWVVSASPHMSGRIV